MYDALLEGRRKSNTRIDKRECVPVLVPLFCSHREKTTVATTVQHNRRTPSLLLLLSTPHTLLLPLPLPLLLQLLSARDPHDVSRTTTVYRRSALRCPATTTTAAAAASEQGVEPADDHFAQSPASLGRLVVFMVSGKCRQRQRSGTSTRHGTSWCVLLFLEETRLTIRRDVIRFLFEYQVSRHRSCMCYMLKVENERPYY